MNIMYAADDNYAEIMGVSILSLLESNCSEDEIVFYIVEDNISRENKARLHGMAGMYGRELIFIKKPDIRKLAGTGLETLRWSDSAYSRLFLKEIFPEEMGVGKILYLDCDTLVVGPLGELWETDTSKWLGAACLECMGNMHKRIIGAKRTDNYINTGMLLLDVKKWVKEDIQSIACDFIRRRRGKTEYVDQGVINGTVGNRFKVVSPRYNLTALAYDFTYEEMQVYRKPQSGYSKEEWEEALRRPVVVHFTASFLSTRPWYEGSRHPYAGKWKEIHDRTPWKMEEWRILENRRQKNRIDALCRKIPRWMVVHGAGFLHAYVKPILYWIR